MSGKSRKRAIQSVEDEEDATPYQKLLGTFTSSSNRTKKLLKKYRDKAAAKEIDPGETKITDKELLASTYGADDNKVEEDVADGDDYDDHDHDDDIEISDDSQSENESEDHETLQSGIKDPFSLHFETDISEEAVANLKKNDSYDRIKDKASVLGSIERSIPKADVPRSQYSSTPTNASLSNAKVKERLIDNWHKVNHCNKEKGPFSELQNSLFNFINTYQDVFYSQRDMKNGEEIRKLYCLHALNHILKTRSRILKNNAKIVQAQKDGKEAAEYRDHGLTRPKVLILVPFRDCALKIVNLMIKLALSTDEKVQVMQRKRFNNEFKDDSPDTSSSRYMPDDFKELFHGNTDDCFRIGITVMRRAIKLYADFYAADILIASPLGLRTIIGAEGEKKRDYDFLSSIEVLIMDQTDVFLMQNWEFLLDVMEHLHLQPKETHDTDLSRVRMWSLDSWSKFYRQSLMFSSFTTPELNSVYNKYFNNYAGKNKIRASSFDGAVKQIVKQIPQIFNRMETTLITDAAEKRFNYFIDKILPNFKDILTNQTAIFIPSYFDFVRVRNYFKKQELDFVQINEYRIRGIKHIIFYQLPSYPVFYSEIINFMDTNELQDDSVASSCTILFDKFDSNRLEYITGSQKCLRILSSPKDTHMIVSES
eukprot:gene20322-22321_t